ncbi:MAG: L,D-transpeptidase [Salaquimonas sp.]|jgi:lipoprotein-anchoring transpeptidase ErfK/SrfK|nr:L,D-transpeptidase [Salaquimonas sp.]
MRQLLAATAVVMTVLMAGPAHAAAVEARIDLSDQRMRVYQYGFLRYTWPVSTARRGYVTPVGSYRPQRLEKMWYSRKYHMSPMPHSVFFRGGYAIHGTNAVKHLGSPASHGCVRLLPANAATFYSLVKSAGNGNVKITITR